jgi:NADH-quinone oxidoreductase subunit N
MNLDLSLPLHLTIALVPELILIVGAMLLMLWAAWRPDSDRHQRSVGAASLAVAALTLAACIWYMGRFTATPGALAVDNFRWAADVVILLGTIFAIALAIDDNGREAITSAESHVLILLASSGMMLLAGARDLMIVFLGIELMSISVYALAGLNRRSARSAEGALKYFLLGAFSTAFLLYGIALVYGATATTNLYEIGMRVATGMVAHTPLLAIGIGLMLIGFGFKVATVPFHMWAPDVYDGSPAAVTAYMAATVKAAAYVAFVRVWLEAFPSAFTTWYPAIAGLAIATMIVGNTIGLVQRNLKRMLAYSSIGHAGYILVAVASGTVAGAGAVLFYLLVYTLATFGAFAVISALTRPEAGTVTLDDVSGLWSVRPWMALGMSVMMLALLGFPLFGGAGFLAKWYVLQTALEAPKPLTTLVVVIALTSAVSAGYYLYVVMVMFMRPRAEGAVLPPSMGGLTRAVLAVTVIAILVLGVAPDLVVRATRTLGRPALVIPPEVAARGYRIPQELVARPATPTR